jgi:hypothetical protein
MNTIVKNPNAKWYVDLTQRFTTLVNQNHISPEQQGPLKQFVLEVAREQYMAGNRSGIRWARNQSNPPQA